MAEDITTTTEDVVVLSETESIGITEMTPDMVSELYLEIFGNII